MNSVSLEGALETLAEDSENADDLLKKYENVKRHLETEYYPWVQANCNWFTDHGKQHIESVRNQSSRLLEDQIREPHSGDLTELDIFALLSAIIWHDVGMVVHRADHEIEATKISDKVRELGTPNVGVKRVIDDIVKAHRTDDGLDIPKSHEAYSIRAKNYDMYPKSLAAILRFADEISETQGRISSSETVRKSVPEDSKIFWKYAEMVQACNPDLNGKRVYLNIELPVTEAVKRYPCPDSFSHRARNDKIPLIEYIICRLEKMNNEKIYCERHFNRYVEIRNIEVSISLHNNGKVIKEAEETIGTAGLTNSGGYPNVDIFDDFFSEYKNLQPSKLPGGQSP